VQDVTNMPKSIDRPAVDQGRAGLGGYLRALRTRRGLSLGGLSLKAGVSRSALCRWEAGTRGRPHTTELDATLRALGLGPGERMRVHAALGDAESVRRVWADLWGGGSEGAPPLLLPGDLLRDLRLRRGWTQAELAERVGARQGAVAKWEASDDWPDEARLSDLCDLLAAGTAERDVLLGWAAARARGWREGRLFTPCSRLSASPERVYNTDYRPTPGEPHETAA
jgi:transcriptional regulator with XRE-family HTH domain